MKCGRSGGICICILKIQDLFAPWYVDSLLFDRLEVFCNTVLGWGWGWGGGRRGSRGQALAALCELCGEKAAV